MKDSFIKALLLIGIAPLTLLAQQQKGYEINGQIEGLKEGEKVTMVLNGGGWSFSSRDSAYVTKSGKFHLTGIVPEGPRWYWLNFDQHIKPAKFAALLIDNGEQISIRGGDIEEAPPGVIREYITVEGSPSDYAWASLLNVNRLFYQDIIVLDNQLKRIRDSVGFDRSLVEGIITAKRLLFERLYWTLFYHPHPAYQPAIPFFLNDLLIDSHINGHQFLLKAAYDSLNEHQKNSFYGKIIKEQAMHNISQPFPEFNLPNPEGKFIALSGVVAKSKVTLVHFWASNSYQRAMYQKELSFLYKNYHTKGLDIIGVSSDTDEKEWKGRIQIEQYPWNNVSDLKGEDGVVAKVYKEYGNPAQPATTNVLIDDKGKIIAWDIDGIELQWYLWKIFGE